MNEPRSGRELHLVRRPSGAARVEDFTLVRVDVPEPADGQVLVRNTWISVDPYMRGRMDDAPAALPPFPLDAPLEGGAVGEVVASRDPAVPVGATVSHFLGLREYSVVDAAAVEVHDTTRAPAEAYLGVLGATGITAYAALTRIAPVRAGDVVFVSAAAGAVGSVAGQLAKLLGAARVIGSAGGPLKTKKLRADFGFDVALDYRAGELPGALRAAAPDGIDVYVDNVGGDHLQAALDVLKPHGRVALVGAISGYDRPVAPPENLIQAVYKSITLRGMQVADHFDLAAEYRERALGWIAEGRLHTEQTVVDGLDQAPAALLGVLSGQNTGKMLVRL